MIDIKDDTTKVATFLNPILPEVQDYCLSFIKELVTNYDFDGFALDYCRYPGIEADFSEASKKDFEKYIGKEVTNFPEDIFTWQKDENGDYYVSDGELAPLWYEYRSMVIHDFIKKVKEEIKEEKIPVNTNNNGLYTKNVLREKRVQTSPIHIDRELSSREELPKEDYHTNEDILTGIDLHEDALSPLETMEDAYEVNDNMKFASDIVERMEEEIKPSNIELTDYERKQEEEAIISYDELLKVKDKIYNITDDEETDEFIDELKNFRIDLQ